VKITPGPPNIKNKIGKKNPKTLVIITSCNIADMKNTIYLLPYLEIAPFENLMTS